MMYVVIRAGGVGSRLWPVSRRTQPKQFHALIGEQSLVRDAYERAFAVVGNADHIFISCAESAVELLQTLVPEIDVANIIVEPFGKNTGPAMCLESAVLETRIPEESVVLSIPSDDFIGKIEPFVRAMQFASQYVAQNPGRVIAPCAPSLFPDCGFCYVEPGDVLHQDEQGALYNVKGWVEKPSVERCQQLIDAGTSFVHMGMYVYQLGAMVATWENLHPGLLHVCRLVARDAMGAVEQYEKIVPASVEALIAQNNSRVAMQVLPDVGWSDVGKWHVVHRLRAETGDANVLQGNVFSRDTKKSLVYGLDDKATVVIGLDEVIVVDTKDGLLVAHANRSDEVKELLGGMHERYL